MKTALIIISILLVLALSFIVFALTKLIRFRRTRKIPFNHDLSYKVGLPIVTFHQGNTSLNLLVDTGSDRSHINSSLLDQLEYTPTTSCLNVTGLDGIPHKVPLIISSIWYKKSKFTTHFIATNLDATFDNIKRNSTVQLHGILGGDFFIPNQVSVSFANHMLICIKHTHKTNK